mgnify:FL=1
MKFSFEEEMLIKAYQCSDRSQLISEMQKSLEWLEDEAVWELAGNVIAKLRLMSDKEYTAAIENT